MTTRHYRTRTMLIAALTVIFFSGCQTNPEKPSITVPDPVIVNSPQTVKVDPLLLQDCADLDLLEPRAYTEKELVTVIFPNWISKYKVCQRNHAGLIMVVKSGFNIKPQP